MTIKQDTDTQEKKQKNEWIIPKLDPSSFTHRRWEAGTIHEIIEAPCRFQYIAEGYGKDQLLKYAVGWCEGEHLYFKPKNGEVGILCFKEGRHFWFHIRNNEFEKVFKKERSKNKWAIDIL